MLRIPDLFSRTEVCDIVRWCKGSAEADIDILCSVAEKLAEKDGKPKPRRAYRRKAEAEAEAPPAAPSPPAADEETEETVNARGEVRTRKARCDAGMKRGPRKNRVEATTLDGRPLMSSP
jgi:hypothetical protein